MKIGICGTEAQVGPFHWAHSANRAATTGNIVVPSEEDMLQTGTPETFA